VVNTKIFHILIVDDDKKILSLLEKFLIKNDFIITAAQHAEEASLKLAKYKFDLIILDIMMPGEDGISFTKTIREFTNTPIILLSALNIVENRVQGLLNGADDFLAKPFEPQELLLKINNIYERYKIYNTSTTFNFGDYRYDLKNKFLYKNNNYIELNNNETSILDTLINNKYKFISRENLAKICGNLNERSIDVIITRIRCKIETDPKNPKFIKTSRGNGYMFIYRS